jgi:hypothetical protein
LVLIYRSFHGNLVRLASRPLLGVAWGIRPPASFNTGGAACRSGRSGLRATFPRAARFCQWLSQAGSLRLAVTRSGRVRVKSRRSLASSTTRTAVFSKPEYSFKLSLPGGPLGPLPLPPGPLNAKHSKRAQGAVFNGAHSPVQSAPSSPPPWSPQCVGGQRTGRGLGPPVRSRSRRLTTGSLPLGLSSELCPEVAKSPRAESVGLQKFDSCSPLLSPSRPTSEASR